MTMAIIYVSYPSNWTLERALEDIHELNRCGIKPCIEVSTVKGLKFLTAAMDAGLEVATESEYREAMSA